MRLAPVILFFLAGCAAAPPTPAPAPPAAPVAEYREGGGAIALYQEPCALAAVSNLPHRAIWRDAGKTFEGCFAIQHQQIVVMYFDDRTVVTMPLNAFAPPEPDARAAPTSF